MRPREDHRQTAADFSSQSQHRKPDAAILEHERKRKVEVKCYELQLQLEDLEDLPEGEVEKQVDALRAKLLAQSAPAPSGRDASMKLGATHEVAAAKQAENASMMKALGINPLTYKEGFAFDREAQAELAEREKAEREQKKIEYLQKKAEDEAKRAAIQK